MPSDLLSDKDATIIIIVLYIVAFFLIIFGFITEWLMQDQLDSDLPVCFCFMGLPGIILIIIVTLYSLVRFSKRNQSIAIGPSTPVIKVKHPVQLKCTVCGCVFISDTYKCPNCGQT
jgi:hypothetical protein